MRFIVLLLAALPVVVNAAPLEQVDQAREAWVIQAREGNLDQAAAGLEQLYQQSGNIRVLDDLIAVQLWRGDRKAALDSCHPCEFKKLSADSLEGLARAARDEKNYGEALTYYRQLQRSAPGNTNAWLGLFLSAVDKGDDILAKQAYREYEQRFGLDTSILEARLYQAQLREDALAELQARQQLLALEPNSSEQIQAMYRVAVSVGAAPAAQALMNQNPELFTAIDRYWLDYYQAAALLRTGQEVEERETYLKALALDENIIANVPHEHPLYTLARRDALVALVGLRRFKQALALSTELMAEGEQPEYVLAARAHTLLKLDRPREAAKIYDRLTLLNPDDKDLREEHFYSYTDSERYRLAHKLLMRWHEPAERWDFIGVSRLPNEDFDRLLQLKVMLTAWRGKAEEAEQQLTRILADTPANPWLWQLMGDLRRWRGKPEGAEQAYQEAMRWLPAQRHYKVEADVMHSRLDRGLWRGNAEKLGELRQKGDSEAVEKLDRRVRRETGPQLVTEFSQATNNGQVQASDEWRHDTRLYSTRNRLGQRVYIRGMGQKGEFDGQDLRASYYGLGVDLPFVMPGTAQDPAQLTLEAGTGEQLNKRGYVWTRLDWRLSDLWALSLSGQLNSADTPLRALNRGSYGDQLSGELRWRQDETRDAGLTGQLMTLSDDNLRRLLAAWLRQDIWRHDTWLLDGTLRMSASGNRVLDVDYFNPEEDLGLGLDLRASYRHAMEKQRSLTQVLGVGGGQYWQRRYDSDNNWRLSYTHDWVLSPGLNLSYGLARAKSVFDGEGEYGNSVFANLEWSFY
ncbi:poly-beta-1,6 N-acetyl-D-glucosamine export porin PgaA [Oceanisphaera litoralis]|uniref:poly-beta-1,6 N-acetyl-D-glucosamine export porin PgaA n=1 Tax=Oceanisphaera litoralis TaxID=225144 RepID=UPI00195CB56E|nr:poly-beta-1,6 N-acetyl-D-glucosamine export porin PgaA [Oceanisphaera litoralis]MBM7455477.1 poly-beta-1,6 N-acetyl-D-glucosamine export porin PgaA [Oceanisphaera litoralis]